MADDVVQQFMASYGQDACSADFDIPHALPCCCGNRECAYLQHSQAAVQGLERDVRQAAKLGSVRRVP